MLQHQLNIPETIAAGLVGIVVWATTLLTRYSTFCDLLYKVNIESNNYFGLFMSCCILYTY